MESISQSFALIVGITFGIVVLVVGFFFLILTVQKMRSFTTLRAIGSETSYLALSLVIQIVILVLIGSFLATFALWAATLASNPAFPLSVDLSLVVSVTGAVLVSSILVGLFSIRRIAKVEPADAAQGRA